MARIEDFNSEGWKYNSSICHMIEIAYKKVKEEIEMHVYVMKVHPNISSYIYLIIWLLELGSGHIIQILSLTFESHICLIPSKSFQILSIRVMVDHVPNESARISTTSKQNNTYTYNGNSKHKPQ